MKEDGVYLTNQCLINKSHNINIFALVDNNITYFYVEQLQKYLSRYGDCLETIANAKQQRALEDTASFCSDRKIYLKDRLLDKLQATRNKKGAFQESSTF
ncbi:hypothetical protein ACJMK2_044046 [Sinanodonta woodiana]|uniref:Uncharacterized protein n=1 Tax=Sinanodonta woodiana TaxID=1069815 RepID=A0ABD3W236_SINWO